MSIIKLNQQPLTQTQILQRQVDGFLSQINNLYQQVSNIGNQTTRFFWANPSLAQSRFDMVGPSGTEAVDLCTLAGLFGYLVGQVTGSGVQIVPSGYSVQFNSNGTVTVGSGV